MKIDVVSCNCPNSTLQVYSYDAHILDVVASTRFTNASAHIQVIAFDAGFLLQNPYTLKKRGNTRGIFLFLNGKLRYTQEAFRYLNITAGAVRKQQKNW